MTTYQTEEQAYDSSETNLLIRMAYMSIQHPNDPHALTADELRHYTLHMCASGLAVEATDDLLDELANQLENTR